MNVENPRTFANLILYSFGFILLWEWLRPVKELTDTGNLSIFVTFAGISLFLNYLSFRFIYIFLIKFLFIVYSLQRLFFEGAFYKLEWASPFIKDILANFQHILQMNWMELTNPFRSLLFFIVLWLMTYLIHYWLSTRKNMFLFFFMTLVFVTVLDTFTKYDASVSIVRSVIVGFVVLGLLSFQRIVAFESLSEQKILLKKWSIPLIIFIFSSTIFAMAAPKLTPQWPDPVPFIKSYSENSGYGDGVGSRKVQRVGYGVDDTRLGGPFIGDNTVVFRADVRQRHYWKVETKDTYTGKGWVATVNRGTEGTNFKPDELVPDYPHVYPEIETTEEVATVVTYLGYPHIIHPAGIKTIQAEPGVTFSYDPNIEKISTFKNNELIQLKQYSLQYEVPKYSVSTMSEATSGQGLSPEFMEQYTRLPEELPQRVKDLAVDITNKKTNWFDKTRAVEQYLRGGKFSYSKVGVAVPGANEDYVDQFLFETNKGYCDNFSTSMIVLLRSVGIPARWVKGYTEGEFKSLGANSRRMFEVTNNNAHSWVEVFFPKVGWVPFEATKGFTSNTRYNFDTYKPNEDTNETPVTSEKKPDVPEEKDANLADNKEDKFSLSETWTNAVNFIKDRWFSILIVFILLLALSLFIYGTRLKWLPHLYITLYRLKKDESTFSQAYIVLLKQLERYGIKRKENQTLREYAKYVDFFYSTNKMSTLTKQYEKIVYQNKPSELDWKELRELWENLIIRTKS